MTRAQAADLEGLFHAEQRKLWALAYRMTGDAGEAEDVVQDAFARLAALPESPAEGGAWLWRVATNLSLDALRRRRRRRYPGAWLPAPVPTGEADAADAEPAPEGDPESRYGLAESATYAFLLALEALGPRQRAVLLLRDVLGHTAKETAALLGVREGHVRVLHLRARRALEAYDRARCIPTPALRERHRAALERFLACLQAGDARGLEGLLADGVHTVTDAAGEFTALAKPLAGRAAVARLYLVAAEHRRAGGLQEAWREVNGLPALLIRLARPVRRQAPASLLRCEVGEDGRIVAIHTVLATRKLAPLLGA